MNDYIKYATDTIYYQKQFFEKTVFKIGYFPTNPLRFEIPDHYSFLSLENSEASFGTIVKSRDNNGYVLRVYNNENKAIEGGKLNIYFDFKKIYHTNLLEDELTPASENLGKLNPGELRNIKIEKV
jgi:alpha-mannosidase